MRSFPSALTLSTLVLLTATWPCAGTASDKTPVTNEEVGRTSSEALDAAARNSAQERARVERKVQAELDELRAGIERLQSRLDHLSEDARRRAEASIADLEKRQEEARRKLEDIKVASEATWTRLRGSLESSMDELKQLLQRLTPANK